jgi:hypothetical protein
MSFAQASSVLSSWMLALALGVGPLGAEVLAALGHSQVCGCCQSSDPVGETTGCCGGEAEEPETPQAVPEGGGCPCSIVAPSGASELARPMRPSEAGERARARLERLHRSVELAWMEIALPAAARESSPAPPAFPDLAGPPGSRGWNGSERAAALGVLRL